MAKGLPRGVIARLGSDHFRNGEFIEALAFSGDGRYLFTSSHWAHHVPVRDDSPLRAQAGGIGRGQAGGRPGRASGGP
jgi:hypothetical protein